MWRDALERSLPWQVGDIRVRLATSDDADLVHALHEDDDVRRFLGGPLGRSLEETGWRLSGLSHGLYLIESGEEAAGFTAYVDNERAGGTDILIVVAPPYQGRSIGRRVLVEMVDRWREFGGEGTIAVSTQVENIKAIRLLERCGFSRQHSYCDELGFSYAVFHAPHNYALERSREAAH